MSDDTGGAQDTPADHPLRMSGRGTFYSFSFDLGPNLDINALADSLLKSDAATVAGAPWTDRLSLCARAAEIENAMESTMKVQEFFSILNSGTPFRWRQLFKLEPRLTLKIAWAFRGIFIAYYINRMLFGKDQQPSSIVPSDFIDKEIERLEEMIDGYIHYLYDDYLIGAARIRLQQQIYLPRYFNKDKPFIRIDMNRSYYSDSSHTNEPIEISLMAHRSGICILTFAIPTAREFGVEDASNYIKSKRRTFEKIAVSIPVLGPQDKVPSAVQSHLHSWQENHHDLDWVVWQEKSTSPPDSIRLDRVFGIYLAAIKKAAKREMQHEWVCNTTLFLGPPRCACVGREAKDRHCGEYLQLMLQASAEPALDDDARDDVLKDYLEHIDENEELWLAPAHAIHTFWTSDRINFLRDMETVEPIESAILQHRQLQAIDNRTSLQRVKDKDWFSAQEELALGLPEYGRNLLTIITAPDVTQGVAEKLKTATVYSRLNDRVKVLESIVNTRFTRKQSRRSSAISVIGITIIVLLLLPRIDEFMTKMGKLTPSQGLVSWLRSVFETSDRATFALYFIAVAFTVLYFAIATIRFSTSRLRRKRKTFGFPTALGLQVHRGPRPPVGTGDPSGPAPD